ncbi:IS66 family transposase [Paenirhodobacter sp.]|uniref:IS66 family transposase n=1 Tax=Paenirhodobacter sp. TaxID=1965326 RepID=UPI003B407513
MSNSIESICNDVEVLLDGQTGAELSRRLKDLWRQVEGDLLKASARVTHLTAEVKSLRKALKKANHRLYSPTADRPPQKTDIAEVPQDTPVADEAPHAEPTQTTAIAKAARRANAYRGGRAPKTFGPGVEEREILIETPDRTCPCGCGGGIRGYDIDRTVECIPAQYYVAVRKYARYRCRKEDRLIGTRFEARVLAQTGMSTSFLAQIICLRYAWYLPWFRQEQIMAAQGFRFQRSTMVRWAGRVALEAFKPIYDLMLENLLAQSARLFMDETTVKQLSPGDGKTRTSYMYALHRDDRSFGGNLPPGTVYLSRRTRAMYNINQLLADRSLIVHHDGYRGYGHLGRLDTPYVNIMSVDCWAHVRRLFMDELKAEKSPHAVEIVDLIAELYSIEKPINGKAPDVRAEIRRRQSVPILNRIDSRLKELESNYLGKTDMGKAIRYVQDRWTGLTRFVENGYVDLDNNPVERQFKQTILLRNNALFIGSDEGGEAWAITSSLLQTCKLNRVDPHRYLVWVLEQVRARKPRAEYAELLPWKAPLSCRIDVPRTR